MKRRIFLLAGLVAVAGGFAWLAAGLRGWREIPAEAPRTGSRPVEPYGHVAELASHHLARAWHELGVVGLSGAASVGGEVVWAEAVGFTDLETRRPVTPSTMFRIGSTSKAITATLLARLVDDGLIDLDTPISKYLPDPPNPEWARLTARQLVSHTAGLPGYEGNRDWWGLYQTIALQRHFHDVRDSLAIFDDTPLQSAPGTRYHYSSFDVNLLAAVMQQAAGEPYLELLERKVLAPLRMTSTGGDRVFADTSRLATFHALRGRRAKPWRDVDLSQKWPSGGLLSTSSDLTKLCGGWFDAAFLEPETVAAFWEPQKLADGAVNDQGYALGWRARPRTDALGKDRVTARYHHGGVSKGAMSWLVCYPEARLGIALNINAQLDEFDRLMNVEPVLSRLFFDRARADPR